MAVRIGTFGNSFPRRGFKKIIRATAQTINGLYVIDPTKNHGKGYQYDEVVRSKEGRKKMHATDCECCREVCTVLRCQVKSLICCGSIMRTLALFRNDSSNLCGALRQDLIIRIHGKTNLDLPAVEMA